MKLTFLGANRQVTGSCYVLEAAGLRVMVDRGFFQERAFSSRNWERSPVAPQSIDAVLLTHAHLDHCGLLPKLVKEGFRGRVICTRPTVELAQLVMEDSARIQEEDVAYKKKRHAKEGKKSPHPYEPLYRREDAEAVSSLLEGVHYEEPVRIGKGMSVRYREAGHILGSAILEVDVTENGETKRVVFSGDIGQWDVPIVGDPQIVTQGDFVVMESTYGDRDHERPKDVDDQIEDVIQDTLKRGGNVVIPTFAIERAQELMVHVTELVQQKRIPRLATFLDSPMAISATKIFERHQDFMDEKMHQVFACGKLTDCWDWIRLTRTRKASQSINSIRGTAIIMAGSGMCTGGRIKHHLAQNIGRPESTILFVGYQAEGTLGREIVNGEPEVRIFGKRFPVRARVVRIEGLSAHAGRTDLLHWLGGYKTPPKKLFLTHGEESAALALAEEVREKLRWDVAVPEYREEFELD